MTSLDFLDLAAEREAFRGRVYGLERVEREEQERRSFLGALARDGVVDCPAYDAWVAALRERGWLPANPDLEPNPDGPGRVGRWRLTEFGRAQWARIEADAKGGG